MSEVARRVVYVEHRNGIVRFHDWALVNHALGTMLEPFCYPGVKWGVIGSSSGGLQAYDGGESMHRVDELQELSFDRTLQIVGDTVIGGTLLPTVGR